LCDILYFPRIFPLLGLNNAGQITETDQIRVAMKYLPGIQKYWVSVFDMASAILMEVSCGFSQFQENAGLEP
jgi:hypothetical protein